MILAEQLSGRSLACILPMSVHELRTLHVPEGSYEQRCSMIASELDELQNPDEWQFDFWDIEAASRDDVQQHGLQADNVSVLIVADSWITQLINDASKNRLICTKIDGLPLALARTIHASHPGEADEPIALLDWGYRSATLAIVVQGIPIYTRRLRDCQLELLVSAIAKRMGISDADAEQLINNRKADSQRYLAAEAIIRLRVDELADEITKTFQFLRKQRPELSPNRTWMYGGGSLIRSAPETITQKTGVSTERWHGDGIDVDEPANHNCPLALLAPAISLSALAFG